MSVTAEAVRQLRERTGAGMMECKKALVETSGDLDAAAELMRKQGLAKADKKAARVAAEGVIVVERLDRWACRRHGRAQLRDRFRRARAGLSQLRRRSGASDARRAVLVDVEALLAAELAAGESVDARRRALVAKIGENISVRRMRRARDQRRARRLRARHPHRSAGGARRRHRPRWRTIWPCTWRPAIRAISASRKCRPRSWPRSARS